MLMWIGVEKEGVHRGLKTLFIGSPKITFKQLEETIEKNPDLEHIYFGAGKCSKINARVLSMFLKKHSVFTITVEVSISKLYCLTQSILNKITLILTINKREFLLLKSMPIESIQVKLQYLKGNDKVLVMTKGIQSVDTAELRNKIYNGDKVII